MATTQVSPPTEDNFLTLADGRKIDLRPLADAILFETTQTMQNAALELRYCTDILRANLFVDEAGMVKPITTTNEFNSMHSRVASLQFKLIDAKSQVLQAMFVHTQETMA